MEESFSTRKLLSGAELKELNTKSDLAGALQLGSHVGAILVLGYLHYLAMGSWWVIATGFCLGVTVNFLYAAQHELSHWTCLLYTSPSPRDRQKSRMPSSA